MGGCLALETLGREGLAGRLAGVFSHASFLNDDSAAFEAAPRAAATAAAVAAAGRASTPVYASHGRADGMVDFAWGIATADRLRAGGITDLTFREHGELDHELGEEQIEGLLDWIAAVAARPGFGQPAGAGTEHGGKASSLAGGAPTVESRQQQEALDSRQGILRDSLCCWCALRLGSCRNTSVACSLPF